MEIGGSRFTSLEIYMQVDGNSSTSMGVIRSFHGNTWKLSLSVQVEASIDSTSCRFHEYIPYNIP